MGVCASTLDHTKFVRQEQTMIAKLTGTLDETGSDWAVLDVGGVGYLVHCSAKTLAAMGERGGKATLYTDLQVSENDMRLLGFAEAGERDWFRLLTGVQGVGSKVALAILSALSTGELRDACAAGDAASVSRANGVGPKLAGRIVNELKEKAGVMPGGGVGGTGVVSPAGGASADAVSALQNLGFKPGVAAQAVAAAQAELGEDASEGELIRVALKRAAGEPKIKRRSRKVTMIRVLYWLSKMLKPAWDTLMVTGKSGLKSLFLVNGGAIIALLTFIGNSDAQVSRIGVFWAFI